MNKLGGKNKKSSGSHKYEDDTVLERFEKKAFVAKLLIAWLKQMQARKFRRMCRSGKKRKIKLGRE